MFLPHDLLSLAIYNFPVLQVYFKNVDFHNRAPRYTKRIEIAFKNHLFVIGAGNLAEVDDVGVQLPYTKTWTNGDRMEIINK